MQAIRTFGISSVVIGCAIGGSAFSAENAAIVGTWRVVDVTQVVVETNEVTRPMGEKPNGFIQYSPSGHMSAVLSRSDLPKPTSLPYPDADRVAIHKGLIAYAGPYTVEGNKVTHHVKAGWLTHWIGGDQVRYFDLKGNTLTIKAAPALNNTTGLRVESVFVFERVD